MTSHTCRFCGSSPLADFIDLGAMPLANSFVTAEQIRRGDDKAYPLRVAVCPSCFLVQADAPVSAASIFSEGYAYFSSYADTWVEHARQYALAMRERLALDRSSLVVEVASNDGYLLQHFVAAGIPVLGIEPTRNTAEFALAKKIPTEVAFFGRETADRLAARGVMADLIAANNVLAHVPDISDFVEGFTKILKPQGTVTFEFPHILNLIRGPQFDTIYHEHFSYLSLVAVERVLERAELYAYDVENLLTHGGSLRLFVCHQGAGRPVSERLELLREAERASSLDRLAGYEGYAEKVDAVRQSFRVFLAQAKEEGRTVAAYGAAAKGNTFLNYCRVTREDIACVFERSLAKQGRFLPGSHVPILPPSALTSVKPDYLVILPWNLKDEIVAQMSELTQWGGRFVTALPQTRIFAS